MRISWRLCVGAAHPSEFNSLNPAGQMLRTCTHTVHIHTPMDIHWIIVCFSWTHTAHACRKDLRSELQVCWMMVWGGAQPSRLQMHPFLLLAKSSQLLCPPGITQHNTMQLSVHYNSHTIQSHTTSVHLPFCWIQTAPAGKQQSSWGMNEIRLSIRFSSFLLNVCSSWWVTAEEAIFPHKDYIP